MSYCPQCLSEYRAGFDLCPDCDRALVEELLAEEGRRPSVELVDRIDVFTTGRRIDAEMVRGLLEAHGLDARIWAGGMGAYRLESAMTEITGVPSAFNAYKVGVPIEEEEEARALLADVRQDEAENATSPNIGGRPGFMNALRSRWLLVAAALFLLVLVILFGPPGLLLTEG